MSRPEVSVILPAFNPDPQNITDAVESILAQSGPSLELIVVDDGSKTPLSGPHHDPRLRIHRQENAGVAAARNVGLTLSRGKFIAFLDDDDTWLPESLALRVKTLKGLPSTVSGVLTAPIGPSSGGGEAPWYAVRELPVGLHRMLGRAEYCELQRTHGYFLLQGALFRREVFTAIGCFDPFLFAGEDQDFLFRVLHHGELAFLQEACFRRMKPGMTADPRNVEKLAWCVYTLLKKQTPQVERIWSRDERKAFWAFHDMAVRRCLRLAKHNAPVVDARMLRGQLSTLFSLRNIHSWLKSAAAA